MKFLFLGVFLVLAGQSWSVEAAPPNIVMIVADDQGWGDYSFMGHAHIRTPQIDRLAAEGRTFRRARAWPRARSRRTGRCGRHGRRVRRR